MFANATVRVRETIATIRQNETVAFFVLACIAIGRAVVRKLGRESVPAPYARVPGHKAIGMVPWCEMRADALPPDAIPVPAPYAVREVPAWVNLDGYEEPTESHVCPVAVMLAEMVFPVKHESPALAIAANTVSEVKPARKPRKASKVKVKATKEKPVKATSLLTPVDELDALTYREVQALARKEGVSSRGTREVLVAAIRAARA